MLKPRILDTRLVAGNAQGPVSVVQLARDRQFLRLVLMGKDFMAALKVVVRPTVAFEDFLQGTAVVRHPSSVFDKLEIPVESAGNKEEEKAGFYD
jgi:hypothetical protein